MRKMLAVMTATVLTKLCVPAIGYGQKFTIWHGEYDRAFRPGAYIRGDGEPYSHWYNYDVGGMLYYGLDRNRLMWLDYYDRLERAHNFGSRMPCPPFFHHPAPVHGETIIIVEPAPGQAAPR